MDQNEQKSLKQIIDYRVEKINQLRDNGVEPYPYSFNKEYDIFNVLNSENELKDKTIATAGRIVSLRGMGKASFMNIQDEAGKIQLYIKNDLIGLDNYDKIAKILDIGDIIGVEGQLFRTKTDQLSLRVSSLVLLSKNIRPLPNIKEKDDHNFFAFEDKENRYRYRHLILLLIQKIKIYLKLDQILYTKLEKY